MVEGGSEPLVIGRYAIFDAIGGGGMAQVYLGRLLAEEGFTRVVAVKRVHPAAANDPQITTMLLDEARLVARVRHPNVVPTIDVAKVGRELILVMEYVRGASLSWLMRAEGRYARRVPLAIAVRASIETLSGLHAAHEAKSERGRPLEMVHRDVSPHNILLGTDGVTRIADFGIAKAEGKLSVTREGEVKGKLAYMAPEQLRAQHVDRRTDVFAMGVVLWELCTGRRLFEIQGDSAGEAIHKILTAKVTPPRQLVPDLPPALDAIVLRALASDPAARFDTAEQMASALEDAITPARTKDVSAWVTETARPLLETHGELIARIEDASAIHRIDDAGATVSRPAPRVDATISSTIAAAAPPLGRTLALAPPPPSIEASGTLVSVDASRSGGPIAQERGPWLVAVLAGLLAVLVVATSGLYVLKSKRTVVSAPSATVAPVASPTAPPTAASAAPEPPMSAIVSAAPSASAAPARAKPKRATPDCEIPYSIDANGLRVPRPECVK